MTLGSTQAQVAQLVNYLPNSTTYLFTNCSLSKKDATSKIHCKESILYDLTVLSFLITVVFGGFQCVHKINITNPIKTKAKQKGYFNFLSSKYQIANVKSDKQK